MGSIAGRIVKLGLAAAVAGGLYVAFERNLETEVARKDAEMVVADLISAVANAPRVVAAQGGWPMAEVAGTKASIRTRPLERRDILRYDLIVEVSGESACLGAVEAGRKDANLIQAGNVVLTPQALMPYRSGKATVEPVRTLCRESSFPLVVRFERLATMG